MDYLTKNETGALLQAVTDPRDLAIIQLFLGAGLYLNEIPELNIDSIDWEKKVLHIKGSRPREIPLNSELFEVLVSWSRERIDNPSEALFITSKGKPGRLSSRAVDKLIRKYGADAGIQKKVNAQSLRNTFAVRLFSSEVSIDNAACLLGISSPKALRRYIKAAQMEKEGKVPREELEKLDRRPKIVREITKFIQRKPKEAKVIKPVAVGEKGEATIGRDSVLTEIRENLSKGLSTMLVGDLGIGKTHLLKVIAKEGNYLYLDSPAPIKQFLQKICEKYCPDWAERLPAKARSSAKEIVELLTNVIRELPSPPIQSGEKGESKAPVDEDRVRAKEVLVIDDLDDLRISDLEVFCDLMDGFIVLAAAEETPDRLKQIWWKFRRIDLPPLTTEDSKELIKFLTGGLTVTDYDLLETRILSFAGGLPLPMVEMVNQISGKPVIKNEDVRDLYHEAGIRYRDWSPILIILWSLAMVSRLVALGTRSYEGTIIAGFGIIAITTITRFFGSVFRGK